MKQQYNQERYRVALFDWGDGKFTKKPAKTGQSCAFLDVRIGIYCDPDGPTYALVDSKTGDVLKEYPLDEWMKLDDDLFTTLNGVGPGKPLVLPLIREVQP